MGRAKDQVLYCHLIYYYLIVCFTLPISGCSTEGFILHNWLYNLFIVIIINLILYLVLHCLGTSEVLSSLY